MDTIDVKGLPKNRVKFLQELIALWNILDPRNRTSG